MNSLISNIKGETCWRAWEGLLPAIFFELGNKQNEGKGEFSISLDTCPWQIFKDNKEIANSKSNQKDIQNVLSLFVEKKLVNISINQNENLQKIIFEDSLVVTTYLNEISDQWYIIFPIGTLIFTQNEISFKN